MASSQYLCAVQIESFKVFCDLAETESFTKAALINNITQSAVSQQITSLERQLKTLLIERSKKKFRLTREGEMLYEHGKKIILTYDGLVNSLQEMRNVISGTIRIAAIYSIGLHDLQPYVKRFLKLHPSVKVHVEYQRANQVYDDVLGNVVDIGCTWSRADGTLAALELPRNANANTRRIEPRWQVTGDARRAGLAVGASASSPRALECATTSGDVRGAVAVLRVVTSSARVHAVAYLPAWGETL